MREALEVVLEIVALGIIFVFVLPIVYEYVTHRRISAPSLP